MFKKILRNPQLPFWLIAVSILIVLTLPTLIQDGMFMDAMLYTSVSHNLSMGIGTFWFPQFSLHNLAGLQSFHEQPPLVFGIQSVFFKLFGDSMYVERFYTFLTMCIAAILINVLWKQIHENVNTEKKLGWLPIILWITIPVCFWSYSNNMHENTMTIFTLSAVILIYMSFQSQKLSFALCIVAGVFIFMATLSKGIPGFFPITIPFLYWLITKKNSFAKMLKQTIIITLIPVAIYSVLLFIPEAKESLSIYLFKRVLNRINEVPTVDSRFYILMRLFMELLPQLSFVIIFFIIAKIKKIALFPIAHIRESVFFIAVGLSASAPLMLTLVQKGFYFVPALPFFAIALSLLIAPIITNLITQINPQGKKHKLFLVTSFLLFMGVTSFTLMQKGKTSRNKELLNDVYLIGANVPAKTTLSISPPTWDQWDLQCYLIRYFNISLEVNYQNNYCIITKLEKLDTLSNYKKIDLPTLEYNLYKKQ